MAMMYSLLLLSMLCTILTLPKNSLFAESKIDVVEYGTDVSYPMQHINISTNYPWLPHNVDPNIKTPPEFIGMPIQPLGDRAKFYQDLLQSCEEYFGNVGECMIGELERVEMSLRQPQSMKNFTDMGFKKIKAPEHVFKLIHDFWIANKHREQIEEWGEADMLTNNWVVPSYMVDVTNSNFRGGGDYLRDQIWNTAKQTVEEWTGQQLQPSSVYGVRVYKNGAILAPHVDRLPLVCSAILQVAQDVDEPWPLEVIGHDGKAHNVTMEPGDLVLYESHSVLHGRPFPMKGRYVANIFIHFEPAAGGGAGGFFAPDDIAEWDHLPDYILPDSPEANRWQKSRPAAMAKKDATPVHVAAQKNDLDALKTAVESNKELIHARDANGWTALHEGARMGHVGVVEYLVKNGAALNARTGNDNGGSALYWAEKELGKDHPVVDLLKSFGAERLEPEL